MSNKKGFIANFEGHHKLLRGADMASKQDETVTTLACLACGSQFPIDSAQAVAMGQGEGCPTCQLELIAENCSPSRLLKIMKEKPHLYFDKRELPVGGAIPYMPAPVVDDTFNDDTIAQTFGELMTCTDCQTDYGIYSAQQKLDSENGGVCLFCQQKNEFLQRNSKKMRLIGIAGQARSGKDTLASYLLDNLDGIWLRSSFADPLKAMLSVIGVDCSDDAKAVIDDSYGVTPRHMMQTLGTEWGRNLIDNDIWVKAFARLNAGMCVIVPDVRFENEADLVRQHGVLIHLVGRGGIEGSHVSEDPIDFKEGDIVIDNSCGLAWLYAQVDSNAVLNDFVGGE